MAWWRERLEELDAGREAPAEPRLNAVREELISRRVSGLELSKLEDAWLPMLEPFPWGERVVEGFSLRGRVLFGIGARLLGAPAEEANAAGVLWSLVDGATHCSNADGRQLLCAAARAAIGQVPEHFPARVRPLTILAALAAYDLRPGGRLGRVGTAVAHRLRGTIAR
jgi:phytoene synthase